MKMEPRCPSTLAAPWQGLGVLLPRGDLISLECPPPRVSLVVDSLFLGGSEELDRISGEWRLALVTRITST
jgi:hypothetical protein